MLSLSCAFQNGMTQPISNNNHNGDAFLVNGTIGGQVEAVGPQGEVVSKVALKKGLRI